MSELYLDLLKRCLLGEIAVPAELHVVRRPHNPASRLIYDLVRRRGFEVAERTPDDREAVNAGRAWPSSADTMIGRARLDNLQECAQTVIRDGVPGDFIETGVWRGGASILMRAVLAAEEVTDRQVWVADSFEGVPPPNIVLYPADMGNNWYEHDAILAVSLERVEANFRRYGLLDSQVRFLKGWFRDTLPPLTGESWAVVRLDGDLYESTMDALKALYPNLQAGGYLIVDDYDVPACKQAVSEYRDQHGIAETIQTVDWTGVFWRKEG
jgi:O-methyltransferase